MSFQSKFLSMLIGVVALLPTAVCISCDEDTATIGTGVMPSGDGMTVNSDTFGVVSRSLVVDSVLATTNDCRLGRIVDPETQTLTTCGFLAQFHIMDNYTFPKKEKMIVENGRVIADSCDIRVFIRSYYGDSLNTMKIRVQELDTANVMEESDIYYTNIDPSQYVNKKSPYQKELTFAVKDLTVADSLLNSSSYYQQIRVKLPTSYATEILNKYYDNPNYFTDSYEFIRHVCPGFSFETIGGVGTMINVDVSTLNIYFRYHTTQSDGSDTIVDGMQRMGATAEVIQSTHVDNKGLSALVQDGQDEYTYIKTPSGIFTEVELPIGDVVAGTHYTDTINSARIDFVRRNNLVDSKYSLSLPSTLLMVRKSEMFRFFEEGKVPDDITSFLASYSSTTNAYSFTNIARLVSYCRTLRDKEAGVQPGDSEAVRAEKYAVWEAANPDWNKVVLIPVQAVYTTTTSSFGTSTRELLRVNNDMSLSSTRLVGGSEGGIKLTVIYSKFAQ